MPTTPEIMSETNAGDVSSNDSPLNTANVIGVSVLADSARGSNAESGCTPQEAEAGIGLSPVLTCSSWGSN